MPLLHFYDRATLLAARDLSVDPELHALISARVAHITAEGLLDMTELIVIAAETVPAEVIAAIGWWPLIDPDGRRHGEPGFVQPFDYVYRASRSFHVAVQTVGNAGFAFEVAVRDDAAPALVALCRELAA